MPPCRCKTCHMNRCMHSCNFVNMRFHSFRYKNWSSFRHRILSNCLHIYLCIRLSNSFDNCLSNSFDNCLHIYLCIRLSSLCCSCLCNRLGNLARIHQNIVVGIYRHSLLCNFLYSRFDILQYSCFCSFLYMWLCRGRYNFWGNSLEIVPWLADSRLRTGGPIIPK